MPDSSARRVRRRNDEPTSALDGLGPFEKPDERLNQRTPHVTRCAWPGCRAKLVKPLPGGTSRDARFGVLCETHAVDVAIAVVQCQKDRQRMWEFFQQQSTEQAVRVAQWRAEDERYEAEKAALRQQHDGFVYYIQIGERLKIGYSVDVKRRMRAYPPGSKLLAVEPGDMDLEKARHRQFAGSRTDGREWFRPTPDVMELVRELVATYGDPKRFAHHYRRNESPVRIRRTA